MSHSLCLRSADDVTIDYTTHYNCDADAWEVISNCWDIDFISSSSKFYFQQNTTMEQYQE